MDQRAQGRDAKPSAEGAAEASGECSLSVEWAEGTDFTPESLPVLCTGILRKEIDRLSL